MGFDVDVYVCVCVVGVAVVLLPSSFAPFETRIELKGFLLNAHVLQNPEKKISLRKKRREFTLQVEEKTTATATTRPAPEPFIISLVIFILFFFQFTQEQIRV